MEVVWMPHALASLDIAFNQAYDLFGERVAKKVVEDIFSHNKLLASFPYIGRQKPYLSHLPALYRSLVVHKHYKLVYRVDDIRQTVYIVALWDTRRNPQQMDNDVTHK